MHIAGGTGQSLLPILQGRVRHNRNRYAFRANGEGLEGAFRYSYIERNAKESESQLGLFDADQYIYRGVISNCERRPNVIFDSYNKRVLAEKHIEELKNQ